MIGVCNSGNELGPPFTEYSHLFCVPLELSRLKIQGKGHICKFPCVRKQAVIKAATELVNQHLVLLF